MNRIIYWVICIGLSLLCACDNTSPQPTPQPTPPVRAADSVSVSDTLPSIVRLSVVGDIMMHGRQMTRAYVEESDSFDFSRVFEYVQPYMDEADLLVGNLETVFAGKNKGRSQDVLGYSSFPCFNAPDAFAVQLKRCGFDLLTTANNHSLDSYPEGVVATLDLLDSLQIAHVGTARSVEEQGRLCVIERNGLRLGFCGYTYYLNGIREPKGRDYLVNDFLDYDAQKIHVMCEEVRRLQRSGVDMTIAYLHCGVEYQRKPNDWQRLVVDSLRGAGCDIILMSHPHILQKVELFPAQDSLKACFVAYSLGNFISSQVYRNGRACDIGAILELELTKRQDSTRLSAVSVVPTYSFWRPDRIGVLPVIEAHDHPSSFFPLSEKEKMSLERAYRATYDVIRGNMDTTQWVIDEERYKFVGIAQ